MNQQNPSQHIQRKQEILEKLRDREAEYGEVLVKSALLYNGKKWENYVTHFILLPKDKKQYPRINEKLEYNNIIFIEKLMSIDQLIEIVNKLPENGETIISIGIYDVVIYGELLSDHSTFSSGKEHLGIPWFFDQYEYQTKSLNRPSKPLLSNNYPVYPYYDYAIEARFLVSVDRSESRGVFFCLPHYQARIEKVSIGQESVKIDIYLNVLEQKDVIGKLYCEKEQTVFQTDLTFTTQEETVDIGFNPDNLYFYLLDKKTEEIIDQKEYSPGHYWQDKGVFRDLPEEELYDRIKQGESVKLEFKRALGDKIDDFVETVVAFANTRGGLVLLGVQDDTQIIGVKKEYTEADITNAIRDRCDPFVQVNVSNMVIQSKIITVIQVPEGDDKPYCLRDKGPLIRAGSSDRTMRRIELDEIYNRDSSKLFSF